MKDYDDKTLEEIEKRVKTRFDAIELEPAEETLAEIRPRLKKKRKHAMLKHHAVTTRVVAAAVSIILFFGIGLTVWLMWPKPDVPPEYRYEDLNIERKPCEQSDITSYSGLYVPDLDILIDDELFHIEYRVGEHKESFEKVYFIIDGTNIENDILRNISLKIILQKKYLVDKEEDYNSDDKITVYSEKLIDPLIISFLEIEHLEPFYNYKIGFKIGEVRYYMDYQTTSQENDIESFMNLFLK